jgi:integral membrane protein (TIGR00529 family)
MQLVVVILLTLSTVVILLHRRVEIGHSMLVGALLLQLLTLSAPEIFFGATLSTLQNFNTWEILGALYFVMCLEFQLRTSGLLDEVMAAARAHLLSDKFLLAGMPAFLGFLPSLGGALFSAPLVENASRGYEMTAEDKTTVNFWFRHVWEFVNPIMPGLLLFSQVTQFPLSTLMLEMAPFTLAAIIIGWIFCLMRLRKKADGAVCYVENGSEEAVEVKRKGLHAVVLTAGPILLNILLVLAFKLPASVSMAMVVGLMTLVLRQNAANIKKMLIHGLDRKLLWGIGSVLLFQQVLMDTGALTGVVAMLRSSRISPLIITGVLTFVTGMLTGTSGGFVAVSMPVVVALAPGEIAAAVVGFVVGTAGQMLSPMHLCILVTVEYFKSNFIRSLMPVALMEVLMIAFLAIRYGMM